MGLNVKIDSLDTVDEKHRDLYKEAPDGKGFVLDVEGYEDTSKLKGALQKEREAAKIARRIKARFPDASEEELDEKIGDALDELQRLRTAAEKAAKKGTKGEDDEEEMKRRIAKREEELRKELEPFKTKAEQLEAEVKKTKIDLQRRKAAEKAGVIAERMDDAMELSSRYVDLDKDGELVVLDEDGDPTGMTLEAFYAKKFKELKPWLYAGSGANGSGANGSQRPGTSTTKDPDKMSSVEKIQAGLAARSKK